MKIILAAIDTELYEAFQEHCHADNVEVHHGNILDLEYDAIVSPANSFGFMDGGIDALYLEKYGTDLQERLQQRIKDTHGGELPVGSAAIVGTTRIDHHPFLIAAPTMRTPRKLPHDTINPYLATRAALLAFEKMVCSVKRNPTIALPGMGTGIGEVPPQIAAQQMNHAIMQLTHGEYTEITQDLMQKNQFHQIGATQTFPYPS